MISYMTQSENTHFKGLIEKASDSKKIDLLAQWALCEFDLFYSSFQTITESAKTAFETRDYQASLTISRKRLSLYSDSMFKLGEKLADAFSPISRDQALWEVIEDIGSLLETVMRGTSLWHIFIQFVGRSS